jgi:hypothetical protein
MGRGLGTGPTASVRLLVPERGESLADPARDLGHGAGGDAADGDEARLQAGVAPGGGVERVAHATEH